MMDNGQGSYFPASSLDPYTRLLASLADLVTKARQSMYSTFWGSFTIIASVTLILTGAWTFLLFTSFIWGPVLFLGLGTYGAAACFRFAMEYGGFGVRKLHDKTKTWVRMLAEVLEKWGHKQNQYPYHDETYIRQRTDAAIKDPGFMRSLFDALPGVDSDIALARVDHLAHFNLGGPGKSSTAASSVDEESDEDDPNTCRSPLSELFLKGLLERADTDGLEEQAMWQAGRPYVESHSSKRWPSTQSGHGGFVPGAFLDEEVMRLMERRREGETASTPQSTSSRRSEASSRRSEAGTQPSVLSEPPPQVPSEHQGLSFFGIQSLRRHIDSGARFISRPTPVRPES